MSIGLLIGAYVIATLAIVFAWFQVPKGGRVRYRLGLGLDGTTSPVVALVGYLTITDVFLIGGILLDDLRAAAIGGIAFAGFAGWVSMRNARPSNGS